MTICYTGLPLKKIRFAAVVILMMGVSAQGHAFTLTGQKPETVAGWMGFLIGATMCEGVSVNWLAHDLAFDWLEAHAGSASAREEKFGEAGTSGAEEADAVIAHGGRPAYCAEIVRRYGDRGEHIPNMVTVN